MKKTLLTYGMNCQICKLSKVVYTKALEFCMIYLYSLIGKRVQNNLNITPVSEEEFILRLARLPKDYHEKKQINAIQLDEDFLLSTQDKTSIPIHLSVWVQYFTTPEQAYQFLPKNSPRKLVLRLKVQNIQAITGAAINNNFYPNLLKVLWVHLMIEEKNGKVVRDSRPGAEGHAGIVGLDEGSTPLGLNKKQAKLLRKDLRLQLAELASNDHWSLENC